MPYICARSVIVRYSRINNQSPAVIHFAYMVGVRDNVHQRDGWRHMPTLSGSMRGGAYLAAATMSTPGAGGGAGLWVCSHDIQMM